MGKRNRSEHFALISLHDELKLITRIWRTTILKRIIRNFLEYSQKRALTVYVASIFFLFICLPGDTCVRGKCYSVAAISQLQLLLP